VCENIRSLLCTLCGGRGLIRPGSLCPRCEGAGHVPRLSVAIPVVGRRQALPSDGPCWLRLAVLSTERLADGRVLAHGIGDEGRPATAILEARALAEAGTVLFSEIGTWP
jgi:hypothetical protein